MQRTNPLVHALQQPTDCAIGADGKAMSNSAYHAALNASAAAHTRAASMYAESYAADMLAGADDPDQQEVHRAAVHDAIAVMLAEMAVILSSELAGETVYADPKADISCLLRGQMFIAYSENA